MTMTLWPEPPAKRERDRVDNWTSYIVAIGPGKLYTNMAHETDRANCRNCGAPPEPICSYCGTSAQ